MLQIWDEVTLSITTAGYHLKGYQLKGLQFTGCRLQSWAITFSWY